MPELYARMDSQHWLTPAIADILDPASPSFSDETVIREQASILQQEMAQINAPIRVTNVRAAPSHTMFVIRPETIGRLGGRRRATAVEIEAALRQIAGKYTDWAIGFIPILDSDDQTMAILLRTGNHQRIRLRRLLAQEAYRRHPSSGAFVAGLTIHQQLVIGDIFGSGNLIIVGGEQLQRETLDHILLSLTLQNTPAELRIAIISENNAYKSYEILPHLLGSIVNDASSVGRLLKGMSTEIRLRLRQEGDENSPDHTEPERERSSSPRIIVILDNPWSDNFDSARSGWQQELSEITSNGPESGIHLIMTAPTLTAAQELGSINAEFRARFVTNRYGKDVLPPQANFHISLLRFTNAIYIEESSQFIVPVETCQIGKQEIQNNLLYWRDTARKRRENQTADAPTPVEELFSDQRPASPDLQTLQRVADALSNRDARLMSQARALAAYLGWLGIGPLRDILLLSNDEAEAVIEGLKAASILEDTDSPTPRFLAHQPPPDES